MSFLLDTPKGRSESREKARSRSLARHVGKPSPEPVVTKTSELGPDNIFAELGLPDAGERLLKATLVTRIRAVVSDRSLSQKNVASILDIPQPKVSELLAGSASGFGAERLVTLLNKLGVSVYVAFHEEPDFAPGETIFGWDRERDSEEILEDEPDQDVAFRP